jgi:hypothetical protein
VIGYDPVYCHCVILGRNIQLETIWEKAEKKKMILEKNEKSKKMETWKE